MGIQFSRKEEKIIGMTWLQATLLGIVSCRAVSTTACLGTSIVNYALNRLLISAIFIGLFNPGIKLLMFSNRY